VTGWYIGDVLARDSTRVLGNFVILFVLAAPS
jgi:hypothetical protein